MTGTEGEYLLDVLARMSPEDIGEAIEHLDQAGDRLARAMAYARRYQLERRPEDLARAVAEFEAAEGGGADRAKVARVLAIHRGESASAGEPAGLDGLRGLLGEAEDDPRNPGTRDALRAMTYAVAALGEHRTMDAGEALEGLDGISVPDGTPYAAILPIMKAALEAERARDDPAASKALLDLVRAAKNDPRLGGVHVPTVDLLETAAVMVDASQRQDLRAATEAARRLHAGLDRLPGDRPELAGLYAQMRQRAGQLDGVIADLTTATSAEQERVLGRYAEASAAAAQAARRHVARGDLGAAVAVLETGRGVLLRAAAAGAVEAGLTRPPTLDEIRAGLSALRLDALVHLVPEDASGDGLALVVVRDEPPFHLPLPGLVPRPAMTAPPAGELCEWAWQVAIGPLLHALRGTPGAGAPPVRLVLAVPGVLGAVPWHAARSAGDGYAIRRAAFSYTVSARLLCEVAWRRPAFPGTEIAGTAGADLTTPAILARPVEADVVTLERDTPAPLEADPVFGPPAAYLVGGARTVFSTGWPAPGPAGPLLAFMVEHFRREGDAPAEALRRAQLWMLDPDRAAPGGMSHHLGRAARDAGLAEVVAWAGVTHHGR